MGDDSQVDLAELGDAMLQTTRDIGERDWHQ